MTRELPSTFGAVLKAARLATGVTQATLAEAIGCSKMQVSRVESGKPITESSMRRYLAGLELEPVLSARADSKRETSDLTDIQKRLQNLWIRGYRDAVSGRDREDRHGWPAYGQGFEVGALNLEAATTAAQIHALNATR